MITVIKNYRRVILSFFLLIILNSLPELSSGQQIKAPENRGIFNFSNYTFTTANLYPEFPCEKIKAVRLSVREINEINTFNSFLFRPIKKSADKTSLFDLLLWAVKEKGLKIYDFPGDGVFSKLTAPEDLESKLNRKVLSPADSIETFSIQEATGYLVLEASIYGPDNMVNAVRPIGLCPVYEHKTIEGNDTISHKYSLFWIRFQDIMDMLKNLSPEKKIKGVKNALDLFLKNQYGGKDISRSFFGFSDLYSDDQQDAGNGDLVNSRKWLTKMTSTGMFVDPYDTRLNGNPAGNSRCKTNLHTENELLSPNIACVKLIRKYIAFSDTLNIPLFYPDYPNFGRSSLADMMLEGLRSGRYTAFSMDQDTISRPLSVKEATDCLMEAKTLTLMNTTGSETYDTIVVHDYEGSEITKFILTEAEFFDSKSNLTGNRLISLIPMLQEYSFENEKPVYRPLLELRLSDSTFAADLKSKAVTGFYPQKPVSYYTYLATKKFRSERNDTIYASLSYATGFTAAGNTDNTYFRTTEFPGEMQAGQVSLATIEVSREDTANYRYFYPDRKEFGLVSLYDILSGSVITGEAMMFYPDSLPGENPMTYHEMETDLGLIKRVTDPEGNDWLERNVINSSDICSYLIAEIEINGKRVPLAICPLFRNYETGKKEKMYWVYLSDLANQLYAQEAIRINCEPELTFGDLIFKRLYKGKTVVVKTPANNEISVYQKKMRHE